MVMATAVDMGTATGEEPMATDLGPEVTIKSRPPKVPVIPTLNPAFKKLELEDWMRCIDTNKLLNNMQNLPN